MNSPFHYHIGPFQSHSILANKKNSAENLNINSWISQEIDNTVDMSTNDETILNLETKDIYIDLEKKLSTLYVKISEQVGIQKVRNAVLIPVSGINKLQKVLDDVRLIATNDSKNPKQIR
jgi:hypothetical protein